MLSYQDQSRLSSIKTYLLIAFIFNLLGLIGFILVGIFFVAVLGFVSTASYYSGYSAAPVIGVWLFVGVIFLIMALPSLLVFLRVNRMRNAANRGDIATLKSLNSTGWAIIALLFTGVLSGIMLLISLGPINELGQVPAYPQYAQGPYAPPPSY